MGLSGFVASFMRYVVTGEVAGIHVVFAKPLESADYSLKRTAAKRHGIN
jgi:hypothetical protein